jgi:PAS domain S-box-containing protein
MLRLECMAGETRLNTEDLRQSEERFKLLVESIRDYAIFMLDPEGHVLTWNAGTQRFKGYSPDEIIGKHFSIFYPDDARSVYPGAMLLAPQAVRYTSRHG